MARAPQNNTAAEPRPPQGRRSRLGRWGGHLGDMVIKVVLAVVFLVVCAGSFLQAFGLPESAIRELEKLAEVRGLRVKAERVYFDWRSGIVLEDVLLGPKDEAAAPWRAGAYRLALDLNFSAWQSPARGLEAVGVEMGWYRPAHAEAGDVVGWRSLEGVLRLHPDGLRVDGVKGRRGPHAVEVRTFVKLGENWQWNFDGVRQRLETAIRPVDEAKKPPGNVVNFERADWQFGGEPRWVVEGILDTVMVSRSRLSLTATFPAPVVYKHWQIDRGDLVAMWDGERVALQQVMASRKGLPFSLEGMVNPAQQTVALSGRSEWRWDFWQSLLGENVRENLRKRQIRLRGPLDLEWTIEEGPFATISDRLQLQVLAGQVGVLGVTLQELGGNVARDTDGAWLLQDLKLQSDHGGVTNRVNGDIRLLPGGQGWSGKLSIHAAPATLQPLFQPTTGMHRLLQRFEIRDDPLHLELELTNGPVGSKKWTAAGGLAATNVWYRGVELEDLQCRFDADPAEIRVEDIYLQRPEGLAQGHFVLDVPAKMLQLDVASTVNFYALAEIVMGTVPSWLRTFTFRGQTMLQATGVVDNGASLANHLTGTLFVEDFSTRVIEGDQAYCYWNATSNRLTCADLRLHMDGGVLAGTVLVNTLNDPEACRWEMMGVVEDVNLHQLVARTSSKKQEDPIKGLLSGRVDLSGDFKEGFRSRLLGEGRVAIDEGQLFRVPVFGGLSGILSKIVPGFGYASQTAFNAKYTIGDNAVRFDPIELDGDVLSVAGAIRLGFDEKLSGTVRVKLLREGLLAELIQGLTWPVSKLFGSAFDRDASKTLGGVRTILPKELFLKFD